MALQVQKTMLSAHQTIQNNNTTNQQGTEQKWPIMTQTDELPINNND